MALWELEFFNPSKGMDLNLSLASLDPDSGKRNVDCHCHSLLTSPVQDLDEVTKDSALDGSLHLVLIQGWICADGF